ncbi:RNA and export factor binding protein, putative [Plasmodium knowlesi strain H]|uniref:RNA and export factor binding protein, putative n=3 Tax=Plasmodium knowlesi TaxID=5850 RepID=A0A5K1UFJ9_PLAKH|nr:RNA and export factor binding protein, putative [Plasmodium knowlesi strain H]OTN64388.1 putative RNA and export factor binding protein [Plasmodium knowlesi]CAA9989168.1 RNA and export factor binding protein, putative [Plasmodium knowlesi strain H]SBO27388.1 RNA and export factor binding protein, putative [Plasmodium knowlesi strain H]SBO27501.1 RNA and export factor binding protein, putative [Plasmodium knowlesi strain H]VVS78642.1 RNA and export factor binding protein, putative [Plasmodiu|eukprot:XP_002261515.1 RNA binding protein, putative [Plasmodium knowlesi strain H]
MREFRKYNNNNHHHRKHYHRQHGDYNNSHNEEYKTNTRHNRINKYNNRNSYQYHDERDSQVRVKISNLDYTISKNDLVELFSNVCKVVNAWINYDHTDRSDGTGVCVFENINDAQKAIDKYDGSEIEGMAIKMEIVQRRNYGYRKKYKSRCPW